MSRDRRRPKLGYHRNTKKAAKVVSDEAYELYPRDWQERADAGRPRTISTSVTQRRGFYSYLGGPDASDKIWASPGTGGLPDQAVGAKERSRFDTVVHELGHRFERNFPEIGAAEWTFWHYLARGRDPSFDFEQKPEPILSLRKQAAKLKALGKKDWIPKYRSGEQGGILDELPDEYIGKTYSQGGSDRYWELLTMLTEDMMTAVTTT